MSLVECVSAVGWTHINHQVLFPALWTVREYADCAKGALGSTRRLGPHALVTVEVLLEQHCPAFIAERVLLPALALVDQVLCQGMSLDDLLALPACGKHGALLPVVDVNRFSVEIFVIPAAKVAHFFVVVVFVRLVVLRLPTIGLLLLLILILLLLVIL